MSTLPESVLICVHSDKHFLARIYFALTSCMVQLIVVLLLQKFLSSAEKVPHFCVTKYVTGLHAKHLRSIPHPYILFAFESSCFYPPM